MANATKREAKTEVVVVDEGGVTLDLTLDEAQILRAIVGVFRSGGPTTPIFGALVSAGVKNEGKYYVANGNGRAVGILQMENSED